MLHNYFRRRFDYLKNQIKDFYRLQDILKDDILSYHGLSHSDFYLSPVRSYDDFLPEIQNWMRLGRQYVYFAKSSGTTAKSKFIPHTRQSLDIHRQVGFDILSVYAYKTKKIDFLWGKNLSITGSIDTRDQIKVGDISALIYDSLPFYYDFFKFPNRQIALSIDYKKKMSYIQKNLPAHRITWASGVTSWIVYVLNQLMTYHQKSIRELLPHFNLLVHGGVSMKPFLHFFQQYLPHLFLIQTYNASEGFFGIEVLDEGYLNLMPQYGNYFEFRPIESSSDILTSREIQIGKPYELILTNHAFVRYALGDVVLFHDTHNMSFEIIGRTKSCINLVGEELMEHNAIEAFRQINGDSKNPITLVTSCPKSQNNSYYHLWLVTEHSDLNEKIFLTQLDFTLQVLNSDYASKRQGGLLDFPQLKQIHSETTLIYLSRENRLSGQAKIPVLSSDEELANALLEINQGLMKI
ncbi:MAG: GH3 auxin-responsive promoter family protein [Chitinophagales bacterium]|jgi:hypothetical protein|nr:GH3 auxin-responsive promoter family protein [Chitinophagales bacterium]